MGGASTEDPPRLSGELKLLPFSSQPLALHAATTFEQLIEEYEPIDVLILNRKPTGLEGVEKTLGESQSTGPNRCSANSYLPHGREAQTIRGTADHCDRSGKV
jgi:hypothetical protein